MARSTSFFGLRKGSTKSHTYQVYRGQQITKDRVTEVANPQTSAQMKQRAKLRNVANAASVLKGIIDHSFQGVEYGYKSVAEFRRLNLTGNNPIISSYAPREISDMGVANYLVSNGNLEAFFYVYPDRSNAGIILLPDAPSDADYDLEIQSDTHKVLPTEHNMKALCNIFGLLEGQQITILVQDANSENSIETSDGENTYCPTYVSVLRLVTDYTKDEFMSGWHYDLKLKQLYNGYFIIQLPTESDKNGVTLTYQAETINETASSWTNRDDLGVYVVMSAAAITSQEVDGTYKRTTSRFIVSSNESAKNLWFSYEKAKALLMKKTGQSDAYLNSGTDTVSITGA